MKGFLIKGSLLDGLRRSFTRIASFYSLMVGYIVQPNYRASILEPKLIS